MREHQSGHHVYFDDVVLHQAPDFISLDLHREMVVLPLHRLAMSEAGWQDAMVADQVPCSVLRQTFPPRVAQPFRMWPLIHSSARAQSPHKQCGMGGCSTKRVLRIASVAEEEKRFAT